MNDGGEFGKTLLEIYPIEPHLKMEHNGSHAAFLDSYVSLGKGKVICKMFDKRGVFNFLIARMLSIISNTPCILFQSSTMSEFVRITRLTLLIQLATKNLLDQMINQGISKQMLLKQFRCIQ